MGALHQSYGHGSRRLTIVFGERLRRRKETLPTDAGFLPVSSLIELEATLHRDFYFQSVPYAAGLSDLQVHEWLTSLEPTRQTAATALQKPKAEEIHKTGFCRHQTRPDSI